MIAGKDNNIEQEKNIEGDNFNKNEKKEKSISSSELLLIIFYLILSLALSFYLGTKQKNDLLNRKDEPKIKEETRYEKVENDDIDKDPVIFDEIHLKIDDVRGKEFLNAISYTLHNVYIDSSDHLIPDDQRTSKNLFDNDIIQFKFIYYLLEKYGDKEYKKYNTNINGLHEVGAYAIKYNYFKEFYKGVMGKEFNEEVVFKAGETYRINGEYLYGKVVTSLNPNYKLSNESFSQIGDKYYYTILIEELDDNQNVILSYRIKLCVSIVNERFMLNSIVAY